MTRGWLAGCWIICLSNYGTSNGVMKLSERGCIRRKTGSASSAIYRCKLLSAGGQKYARPFHVRRLKGVKDSVPTLEPDTIRTLKRRQPVAAMSLRQVDPGGGERPLGIPTIRDEASSSRAPAIILSETDIREPDLVQNQKQTQ